MDSDRLIRYSFPGIVYIFYVVFFYVAFTGRLDLIDTTQNRDEKIEVLGVLLLVVTSTPLLGFMISTFTMRFLEVVVGYRVHFTHPPKRLLDKIKVRNATINTDWKPKYEKRRWFKKFMVLNFKEREMLRLLYIEYMVLRQKIVGEPLKFLERRWNIYWIHTNNIASILLALGTVLLFAKFDNFIYSKVPVEKWTIKELIFVMIGVVTVLYVWIAQYSARRVKHEAIAVEHGLLIQFDEQEEEAKSNQRVEEPKGWKGLLWSLLK